MRSMTGATKSVRRSRREGSLLVVVAVAVGMGSVLMLGFTWMASSAAREQRGSRENLAAFYVAEAAVSAAVYDLEKGGTGNLGSEEQPANYGNSSFWVEAVDQGGHVYTLIATGVDEGAAARVEVVVGAAATGQYQWAAFGDDKMVLDSNAFVDSYDSSKDTYDNQKVNSNGGDSWANANGDIGSNADIAMKQNSTVFGDAQPGPTSSVSVVGNAYLDGASTPAPATQAMEPIVFPATASSGPLEVSGAVTLPAGDYAFDSVLIKTGATLTVEGPSTLVCGSMELKSNSQFLVDSDGGGAEVYVDGDFIIGSNTLLTSLDNSPEALAFYLNSDNVIDPDLTVDLDEVDFNSNAQLYGTIYAPNAAIEVNSNFELFGGLMAFSVLLDSNAKVHYDEALATAGFEEDPTFEKLFWKGSAYSTHND